MNSNNFLHYTDPQEVTLESATVPTLCGLSIAKPTTSPSAEDYARVIGSALCPACEAVATLIEYGRVSP